jgi:hypothetical protein
MRFSRIIFWGPTTLCALLLLLALGTGGCNMKPKKGTQVRLACGAKHITVDPGTGVDQQHMAVYVCENDPVTWEAPPSVTTFTVHFPGACPFTSCADISDSHPRITAKQPADLTVYKYTITVNNGPPFDPHVVGGGGN